MNSQFCLFILLLMEGVPKGILSLQHENTVQSAHHFVSKLNSNQDNVSPANIPVKKGKQDEEDEEDSDEEVERVFVPQIAGNITETPAAIAQTTTQRHNVSAAFTKYRENFLNTWQTAQADRLEKLSVFLPPASTYQREEATSSVKPAQAQVYRPNSYYQPRPIVNNIRPRPRRSTTVAPSPNRFSQQLASLGQSLVDGLNSQFRIKYLNYMNKFLPVGALATAKRAENSSVILQNSTLSSSKK